MTASVGLVASICQPSTLRIVICPDASSAQKSMAAVSGDGRTVWVLMRRLNSSCRRSTALVVRADRHWPGGRRVKVTAGQSLPPGCRSARLRRRSADQAPQAAPSARRQRTAGRTRVVQDPDDIFPQRALRPASHRSSPSATPGHRPCRSLLRAASARRTRRARRGRFQRSALVPTGERRDIALDSRRAVRRARFAIAAPMPVVRSDPRLLDRIRRLAQNFVSSTRHRRGVDHPIAGV